MFWRCLSGQHLSSQAANLRLQNYYNNKQYTTTYTSSSSHTASTNTSNTTSTKKSEPLTVLLLDEIDFLSSGDGKVFYSFFNWPKMANARLALIGISNVMDLTEKLMTKCVCGDVYIS